MIRFAVTAKLICAFFAVFPCGGSNHNFSNKQITTNNVDPDDQAKLEGSPTSPYCYIFYSNLLEMSVRATQYKVVLRMIQIYKLFIIMNINVKI